MFQRPPAIISYESTQGNPGVVRSKADIIVRISEDNLWEPYQFAEAQQAIRDAVTRDLVQNVFYFGEEQLSAQLIVEELDYSTPTTITPLLTYLSGSSLVGYGLYLINEPETDAEHTRGSIIILTGSVLVLSSAFIPAVRPKGIAQVRLTVHTKEGRELGSYSDRKEINRGPFSLISGSNNTNNPYVRLSNGGILKDALMMALENIKAQVVADPVFAEQRWREDLMPEEFLSASGTPVVLSEDPNLKANIAVVDFEAFAVPVPEAQALTNRLRVELLNTGRFIVLERGMMLQVLEEQDFQASGCTTNDCLVKIGQLLNMQQMVAGSVSKVGDVYSLEVRIIDVSTGEIVGATIVDMSGSVGMMLTDGVRMAAQRLTQD